MIYSRAACKKASVFKYCASEVERGAHIHTRRTATARKTCMPKDRTTMKRATNAEGEEEKCATTIPRSENDTHARTNARLTHDNRNPHAKPIALSSQYVRRQGKLHAKKSITMRDRRAHATHNARQPSKHGDVDANAGSTKTTTGMTIRKACEVKSKTITPYRHRENYGNKIRDIRRYKRRD